MDSWDQWGNHILEELKKLNTRDEIVLRELTRLHIAVATLKVKSGIWGIIGGAISIAIFMFLQYMKSHG